MNCCDDFGNCRGGHGCPIADGYVDTEMMPRTMQEAFGPGADLAPIDTEIDWPEVGDQAVAWTCVACALVILALAVLGAL